MEEHRKTSKFKAQVVLELLKGENLEELSRKYAVTMSEINAWRDEFIRNGTDGFKRNPEEAKLSRAERKIGQLEMELVKKERQSGKTKKAVARELMSGWRCHTPSCVLPNATDASSASTAPLRRRCSRSTPL